MRVRLITVLVGVLLVSSLSPVPEAVAQPVNPGAGASTTRDGAIADARYGEGGGRRNFADTDQSGGGGGGRRTYDCEWYYATGEDKEPWTWPQLVEEYGNLGLTEPEPMYVQVLCRYAGTDNLAPWSSPEDPPVEWNPGITEPVPDVDPATLAEEAIDELTFPVPNGQTSPPLDTGSYAQLTTYFEVNDWVTLTASAAAGPITSTVTATPNQLEIVLIDNVGDWWDGEPRSLGTANCEEPAPDSGSTATCEWDPPHSSAGQVTAHPTTGEPCFEVVILVEWSLNWSVEGADGGGPLPSAWMGSSTCIVVAEIQAVIDDA